MLRAHRAGGGLGREQPDHARAAGRRRLRAGRPQGLRHQRARGRHRAGVRPDRPERGPPRHQRLPRGEGHAGLHGGEDGGQARHPRLRHRRAALRGVPGARVPAPRRGRAGIPDRPRRARRRSHWHRGPGGRHRDRGLRGRARVRARAEELRGADRPAPDGAVDARGHGHHHRGGPPAHPARGLAQGLGRALRPRGGHGQAVRLRDRDAGDHRRDPGARRLRLHQGVPGRAPLPRRQDHPDLRGHVPDPEAGRRPSPARRRRVGGLRERESMAHDKERWEGETYGPFVRRTPERDVPYETLSGIPVQPLYTPEDLVGWRYEDKLGYPGEFPYTRGPYPSMYRGRLWTMRMFAGFGRPEDTNARFKYLLQQGQTGLSTAFDMPALMGYDADHPRARGEVGREGVSISTLADFEILFRDIPLGDVTTSMTINCTASVALAMYLAIADKQGVAWDRIGGTMQNDMLKEFIAQKEWICPPEPAVRIVTDMIEFTSTRVPRFNPVSISGYHIREAGSTAVQELAFTLADGLGYVEAAVARGLDVDSFAPRLSFFFDIHNDFFEEIAKLRAARRVWARFMKERFGARKPESMRLRTHTQTAGVSATAQQPLNNIARVALQALAAVLGGAQSLHTNSYDETWALPTEDAVTVALRTQQIIAEETGVALTIDPLGGSYYLEKLTDQMEAAALDYIGQIDAMGGMIRAIDHGYPQKEIADAAYRYQLMDDRGEKVVVGVNKYVMRDGKPINYLRIDEQVEVEQIERVSRFKAARDVTRVERRLKQLADACRNGGNVMPVLIDAVKDYVSLGEISDVYRQVFGIYREPIIF